MRNSNLNANLRASANPVIMAVFALASLMAVKPSEAQSSCPAWTDPHSRTVEVGPDGDLVAAVRNATSGTTVLMQAGTYKLRSTLQFTRDDVTLRSKSGKREDVILDGDASGGGTPDDFTAEIIAVSATGITLADFTVKHARDHAVHAYPPSGRPIARLHMRNLHVSDCGQQLIKVNSNGGNPLYWVDSSKVECSFIGFIDNSVMEASGDGFYTGGIDIHGGRAWTIRGNLFRNIQRDRKNMEHAVHLWSKSRDCVIEGNRFEDVYRAIGLGMKTEASGHTRMYPDDKGNSPYSDFIGGKVVNNMIWNRSGIHLESGIEIMNAIDVVVAHNTVWSVDAPFSSIEYRWPNTQVTIKNNLVSRTVMRRNDANATLGGNVENAPAALLVNAATGNLHLVPASPAIGKGVALEAGWAETDIDGEVRDTPPDAGADEWTASNGSSLQKRLPRKKGNTGLRKSKTFERSSFWFGNLLIGRRYLAEAQ
jgi:hypothetical protein